MWKSTVLALALLLLPGSPSEAEAPVGEGGAFVWINIQGNRLPGYKLKSEEVIRFSGYSLAPPRGEGWRVLRKGPYDRGVGFARRSTDKANLIWAASFVLALNDSVDGIVRGLVGQPYWRAPEGFRVVTASGTETVRDSTRCVRVSATARKTPKKPRSKSGLDFTAQCLACAHPTAPKLYVVLIFAERKQSRSTWLGSLEDAEEFFDTLQFGDLRTPIEENFNVSGSPFLVAPFESSLWVALGVRESLVQMNPATGEVLAEIDLPGTPLSMVVGQGSLWVITSESKHLLRIDPVSHEVTARIELSSQGKTVITGADSVWVTCGLNEVSRIDPGRNLVVRTIKGPWLGKKQLLNPLPAILTGMVYSEPWLWIADGEHNRVFRVDPKTNQIVGGAIKVGRRPRDLVATERSIWVLNRVSQSVSRLDRQSGEVLGEVEVEGEPILGVADAGTLWVSSPYHSAVSRIDTTAPGRVAEPIWVGIRPLGLAVAGGFLWVADGHGDTLSKIRIGDRQTAESN